MGLRRWMDKRYAQGREDARLGKLRDPGNFGEHDSTYQRWAYDAGYAAGQREFEQMRLRMTASNTNSVATVPPASAPWPRFRLWGRNQ